MRVQILQHRTEAREKQRLAFSFTRTDFISAKKRKLIRSRRVSRALGQQHRFFAQLVEAEENPSFKGRVFVLILQRLSNINTSWITKQQWIIVPRTDAESDGQTGRRVVGKTHQSNENLSVFISRSLCLQDRHKVDQHVFSAAGETNRTMKSGVAFSYQRHRVIL